MVLSGSLPPGVPDDWYADVVARLRDFDCRVAVDTSEGPLSALAAAFDRAAPDLLKPNSEELAGLAGPLGRGAGVGCATTAIRSRWWPPHALVRRGVGGVLATLGAAGAVLVDGNGAWIATPPPITPRSTVGAGDSSLAGYLLADVAGADAAGADCGWRSPTAAPPRPSPVRPSRRPAQLDLDAVRVSPISPAISAKPPLPTDSGRKCLP